MAKLKNSLSDDTRYNQPFIQRILNTPPTPKKKTQRTSYNATGEHK
jgi:hypothetical protein